MGRRRAPSKIHHWKVRSVFESSQSDLGRIRGAGRKKGYNKYEQLGEAADQKSFAVLQLAFPLIGITGVKGKRASTSLPQQCGTAACLAQEGLLFGGEVAQRGKKGESIRVTDRTRVRP
jgi:hypothetical protein